MIKDTRMAWLFGRLIWASYMALTQHPLHVIVDHLAPVPEHCHAWGWVCAMKAWTPDPALFMATALLALVTGGLFFATFRVAKRTQELAADTVEANMLADQHHQESLSPVVVLHSFTLEFIGQASTSDGDRTESSVNFRAFFEIENQGFGPAIRLQFGVSFANDPVISGDTVFADLRSLKAGDLVADGKMLNFETSRVEETDRTPNALTVTLRYFNAFNMPRSSLYRLERSIFEPDRWVILSEGIGEQDIQPHTRAKARVEARRNAERRDSRKAIWLAR